MGKFLTVLLAALLIGGVASSGGSKTKWRSKRVTVHATAYCPCSICCGKHADGKTATGRNAWLPGVAIDPGVIPLGSRLDIPGYHRSDGTWILADDTGRAINDYDIDVRFETHAEAVRWGTKDIVVRVWYKSTE